MDEWIIYIKSQFRWRTKRLRNGIIEELGGIPLNHHRVREWQHKEYIKALAEMRATIEKADKVYLEPVTLNGNVGEIRNCVFLGSNHNGGTALQINPPIASVHLANNTIKF